MSEATTSPCSQCGAEIPADVAFCPSCGSKVADEPDSSAGERDTLTEPASVPAEPAPIEAEAPVEAIVPEQPGIVLDWDDELVELVREAAAINRVTVSELIRELVIGEVKTIVAKRRGMISLADAANVLGVTKREIVQRINAGELRARKVDGEWMVDRTTVGETEEKTGDRDAQLELDLRELTASAGLDGLDLDSRTSDSVSATLCYVSQQGVLVCPREAWRKLGHKKVLQEAKDAVRRYLRRRDRDLGRL